MAKKLKDVGLTGPVKMPGLEFGPGDEVELRSDDEGYVGARFKATVLEVSAIERRAKVLTLTLALALALTLTLTLALTPNLTLTLALTCCMRRRPSKLKGFVTMPTVSVPA